MTESSSKDYDIQKTKFGRLFSAKIQQDTKIKEATLKTWDFFHFFKVSWKEHPAIVHDEIVLLMKY